MTEWHGYAQTKLDEFLLFFDDGLRDLRNEDLSPYYAGAPMVPDDESQERYAASQEFRTEEELPPVGADAFASQLSEDGSQTVFQDFVESMGIEEEVVDDITEETAVTTILGFNSLNEVLATLEEKGFTPDYESVQAKFADIDIPVEDATVLHIDEPFPSVWGEEDSVIAEKLRRSRRYVKEYLELEGV
jgi:hypothetical protein